jgi:cytoskeletal protein CcmA (bactofilin family)
VFPVETSSTGRMFEQSDQPQQPDALLPTDHPVPHDEAPRVSETPPGIAPGLQRLQPGRRAMPEKASEAAPAPGPITISTFQKMKEQGYYRQQYFKEVECFDCHHKFKVGRSARSTQCSECGIHICLEDMDINVASTQPILTRGDVMIRKNGHVNASQIKCRDLKIFGMVSAQIECVGDLLLRTSGSIIGEIRCRRFVVEKGSDLRFLNMIHAEDVELHARVVGNIQCSGRVLIGAQGWIHGDVTARSVSIEPGGQLDGAMNILRATPQVQPAPPVPAPAPPVSAEAVPAEAWGGS